jgi:hypothetical protein
MIVADVVSTAADVTEDVLLKIFLAATLVCLIVLLLGRLHSYYLDENERIAKGLRRSDR